MNSLEKYFATVKKLPTDQHGDFNIKFIACLSVNEDFEDKGWDYALKSAYQMITKGAKYA